MPLGQGGKGSFISYDGLGAGQRVRYKIGRRKSSGCKDGHRPTLRPHDGVMMGFSVLGPRLSTDDGAHAPTDALM